MSDLGERIARVTFEVNNLRPVLKQLEAATQQVATLYEAATATDWEDRYIAEGIAGIEADANCEPPP